MFAGETLSEIILRVWLSVTRSHDFVAVVILLGFLYISVEFIYLRILSRHNF